MIKRHYVDSWLRIKLEDLCHYTCDHTIFYHIKAPLSIVPYILLFLRRNFLQIIMDSMTNKK